MKKILTGIGSILMLAAPFTTVATHYGYKCNLFNENGFGPFGKIAYVMIIIGVVLFVLSRILKKRWVSIIGLIPITLVLAFLIFVIVNTSENSGNTISIGTYAIIIGGVILWISMLFKDK